MHVLIVEEDVNLRSLWSQAFEKIGHSSSTAVCFDSACALLKAQHFDVALVELCLRGGSGLTVGALVKYHLPFCPVLIMTGSGLFPNGELYELAPAITTVLRKPIETDELLAVAEYYCRQSQLPLMEVDNKKGGDTREEEGAAA